MRCSTYTSYSLLHLALCLRSQQDAQEFLIYLLEGLHEDLNRSDKKKSHMILPKEQEEEEDRLRYVLLPLPLHPSQTFIYVEYDRYM